MRSKSCRDGKLPVYQVQAKLMPFTQTKTLLSVAVVLYHSPIDVLRATLLSVVQAVGVLASKQSANAVRLVLVDNSDCDAYEKAVSAMLADLPRVTSLNLLYQRAVCNKGFAAGHNQALRLVDSQFHLVLNPDVELSDSALEQGLNRLQSDPNIVLLSPRVCDENGQQLFLCKAYPSVLVLMLRAFAPTFVRRRFQRQLDNYELREQCSSQREAQVPLASGCFMLMPTAALRDVGGFSEAYFLYFEDFDLSLKMAEKGQVRYFPAMEIVHHGGQAARKGWRHIWLFMRAGGLFFRRHGWKWI